ncbi:hypothetical protein IW261DRAFT_1597169 [Armillaria novae-zelandiae]|uniref:Uncharacterized protein n=1 Tax=Armillaria novae-zelandiae TaxID=153914 RepID=A0AA39NTN9_9AGAR|nr:hypothetical protein IW261DRAFT_1597169 [Armillaria novae-zelandiae]
MAWLWPVLSFPVWPPGCETTQDYGSCWLAKKSPAEPGQNVALISKNPDGEEGETTACNSVLSVDVTYASLLVVKNIHDNTDEEGSCDLGSDSDVFNDEEIDNGGYGVSINEVDEIINESMQFQVNEPTNSPNIPIPSIHHVDPISISETVCGDTVMMNNGDETPLVRPIIVETEEIATAGGSIGSQLHGLRTLRKRKLQKYHLHCQGLLEKPLRNGGEGGRGPAHLKQINVGQKVEGETLWGYGTIQTLR